jgi:hypothetical protein
MPTIISGDTGIDKIAAGAIEFADLPTGSVLQVVNAVYLTNTSTSSGTLINSGLTVSITPKFSTSKVLVLVSHNGINKSGTGYLQSYLFRNSTNLLRFDGSAGYNTIGSGSIYLCGSSATYFDSPATTSATTYKTQIANGSGSGTAGINMDDCYSTITVMEIAA